MLTEKLPHKLKKSLYLHKIKYSFSSRSSHPEFFCKNDALKDFAQFTGKYLCRSLFFNKVAGLSLVTLLKKRF